MGPDWGLETVEESGRVGEECSLYFVDSLRCVCGGRRRGTLLSARASLRVESCQGGVET